MAKIVDLTIDDDDDAHSTSSESGSKSGYTTPSAKNSTSSGTVNHLCFTNHLRAILFYNKVLDLTTSTGTSSSSSLPANQNFNQG